jgi:hypothetical protein
MNKNSRKLLKLCGISLPHRKQVDIARFFSDVSIFERLIQSSSGQVNQYCLEILLQASRRSYIKQNQIDNEIVYGLTVENGGKQVFLPVKGEDILYPEFHLPSHEEMAEECVFYKRTNLPLARYAHTLDSWQEFSLNKIIQDVILTARLYECVCVPVRDIYDECYDTYTSLLQQQQKTIVLLSKKIKHYRSLGSPFCMQERMIEDLRKERHIMRLLKECVD